MGVRYFLGGPKHAQRVEDRHQDQEVITWHRIDHRSAFPGEYTYQDIRDVYVRRTFLNIMVIPPIPGLEDMSWAREAGFTVRARTEAQAVQHIWPVEGVFWVYEALCEEGATTLAKDHIEALMILRAGAGPVRQDHQVVSVNGVPQQGLTRLAMLASARAGFRLGYPTFRDINVS